MPSNFSDVFGMNCAAAKIVPKLLNFYHKQLRIDIAQEMLRTSNYDPDFFKKVITGNESWDVWLWHWKPKPNHPNGNVQKGQDRKKHVKFRQKWRFCLLFSSIAMACCIMNSCHKVINKKYYLEVICRLREAIRQKHIEFYIHNWSLQPFSQDYGLASYTTQVACVKFYT